MTVLTVLIDPGNFSTKYVYRHQGDVKVGTFYSITHKYEEMETVFNNEVKRVSYGNFDYYIGKGAAKFHASEEMMYRGNKRKGHHEGIIRIVGALHEIYKETGISTFNVVTTSPYTAMKKDKDYFEQKLNGARESVVDNKAFNFTIENLRVAAEGLGALAFTNNRDLVVVDAGSMTMNILYLIEGTINAARSKTLNGGTIKHSSFALADSFSRAFPDVDYDKEILVTGGKSEAIAEALQEVGYENAKSVSLTEYPAYYVNVVGLFLTYEKRFEMMFA